MVGGGVKSAFDFRGMCSASLRRHQPGEQNGRHRKNDNHKMLLLWNGEESRPLALSTGCGRTSVFTRMLPGLRGPDDVGAGIFCRAGHDSDGIGGIFGPVPASSGAGLGCRCGCLRDKVRTGGVRGEGLHVGGSQLEAFGKGRDQDSLTHGFLKEAMGGFAGHHIAQADRGGMAGAKNDAGQLPAVGLAIVFDLVEGLFALQHGHDNVHDQHEGMVLDEEFDGFGAIGGLKEFHRWKGLPHDGGIQVAGLLFVVDQ